MALIFLDSFGIVTGSEGSHCVRVTKIMEASLGHTQFCYYQFERPVSCLGCDPVTGLIREYQTGFFVEILVICSVGILFRFLLFQKFYHKGSDGQMPFLAVLGGNQCVLIPVSSYGFSQTLKLFVHQNGSGFQIYTIPLQTADLSFPEPGEQGGENQIFVQSSLWAWKRSWASRQTSLRML